MVKYSVIVPVYKVEAVLPRCIESILNQTVPDFELILIDDGSPDRSGAICDEYAAKDARIRVIHQENGGVSRARNAGLDVAQGQYIVFVDSDDYIEKDHLKTLGEDDCDLVITGMTLHRGNGTSSSFSSQSEGIKSISTDEERIAFLNNWYALQTCCKRLKRCLIIENNLQFDETLDYGEDAVFIAEYLMLIQSMRISDSTTYHYCFENEESLCRQAEKHWFSKYNKVQEKLLYLFEEHSEIQTWVSDKLCWVIENELAKICNSDLTNTEKKNIISEVLNIECFPLCLRISKEKVPFFLRWVYKMKCASVVLLIWKLRRTKNE